MGRYVKEARHNAEKIQYYYDHAGYRGYSQAKYHYSKLSELMMRAHTEYIRSTEYGVRGSGLDMRQCD